MHSYQSLGPAAISTDQSKLARALATLVQTAAIIKTSARKPADRMGWIEECINKHADLPNDPTLAAFKMRVEGTMVDIQGRHLPPPELQYGNSNVR